MDQRRFALGKDFTFRRCNRVNQGNVIKISAVGNGAHITGNSDRGENRYRLSDAGQNCLAAAPLDIVHIIIGVTDDRLEVNHVLGHIQFFHEDCAHVVQPVAFVEIDCHIH